MRTVARVTESVAGSPASTRSAAAFARPPVTRRLSRTRVAVGTAPNGERYDGSKLSWSRRSGVAAAAGWADVAAAAATTRARRTRRGIERRSLVSRDGRAHVAAPPRGQVPSGDDRGLAEERLHLGEEVRRGPDAVLRAEQQLARAARH